MSGTKTLKDVTQELKGQVCPEWQDAFVSYLSGDNDDFNAHVGRFSDGCRVCWPALRKFNEFMAGAMSEVVDMLRKGPSLEQTPDDFAQSIEMKLNEIDPI